MIPLYDETAPQLTIPYIVIGLILLNIIIFCVLLTGDLERAIKLYGMIPAEIFRGRRLVTLFSSMFIHAGAAHLISNMWFLWLFGDNIEHKLGALKFLLLYFLAGIVAGVTHLFFVSKEVYNVPVVGASGAISGILGAYLVFFPHNQIRAFIVFGLRPLFFYLPAYLYIGVWFFLQLFFIGTPSQVAYEAHVGGFLTGLLFAFILSRLSHSKKATKV